MGSILKNLTLVMVGSLLGAATILGFVELRPAATTAAQGNSSSVHAAPLLDRLGATGEDVTTSIYERLSPAVVNITNRRTPRGGGAAGRSLERGVGSGVIIDDQGHILSNNHVVDQADSLEVTLSDGTRVPARLVGRDVGNDLAVVEIDLTDDLRSRTAIAPLGDSDLLKPGQLAIAIGNPFGFQGTMTTGIISSLGRTFLVDSGRPIRHMIQTDAAINPGNSGGPLINSAGEVVGINTAIESPIRGFVGVGFSVPINVARRHMPEMLAGESVAHPWLGISGIAITEDVATEAGLSVSSGVYVVHVVPDSPAQKAGLQGAVSTSGGDSDSGEGIPSGGDVLTAIDGNPVAAVEDISDYVDSKKAGDRVTVTVLRDGDSLDLQVTLANRPDE